MLIDSSRKGYAVVLLASNERVEGTAALDAFRPFSLRRVEQYLELVLCLDPLRDTNDPAAKCLHAARASGRDWIHICADAHTFHRCLLSSTPFANRPDGRCQFRILQAETITGIEILILHGVHSGIGQRFEHESTTADHVETCLRECLVQRIAIKNILRYPTFPSSGPNEYASGR